MEIDRTKLECYHSGIGYFHIECLEDFRKQHPRAKYELVKIRTVEDVKIYVDKIYNYLTKEVGLKVNYGDLMKQCKNFKLKYKYTYKGIYLTLKYFYGVKKGSPEKSNNRIGIIPYVYEEARSYYETLERKKELINSNIYKQKNNIEKIQIAHKKQDGKKRIHINLDELIEQEKQKEKISGR